MGQLMNTLPLTELFSAYIVLAIGYNVMSVVLDDLTDRRAAVTDPMMGLLLITALYLTYATGPTISNGLYLFVMTVFTLFILRFGILRHVLGYDEDVYYSRVTWAAAFLINIFGVAVLVSIIVSRF